MLSTWRMFLVLAACLALVGCGASGSSTGGGSGGLQVVAAENAG